MSVTLKPKCTNQTDSHTLDMLRYTR